MPPLSGGIFMLLSAIKFFDDYSMTTLPISSQQLPKHIAIIMDGNGRWAKTQGKPRTFGHKAGVKAVKNTIQTAARLNVEALTLFAFSRENWRRPQDEVSVLMDLFLSLLTTEIKRLHKNNFKLQIIGDKSAFSKKLQQKIAEAEQLTENNTGLIINVAANYGGQWDIAQAMTQIAKQVKKGELEPESIDEKLIEQSLCLAQSGPVDLLIRTSGESRLSNFLLWQIAYSELYFWDKYWPEFDEEAMLEAISWFVNRERRFGCTGDQIKALMIDTGV